MRDNHIIQYNSREFRDFMDAFRARSSSVNNILVFAGESEQDRVHAINTLKRDTAGKVLEIDLYDIISLDEQECSNNIDEMADQLNPDAGLIIFRNGNVLNGHYTGFTASAVKYGTPQEKYFLNKMKSIPATILIELSSADQLDRRLTNVADTIITFSPPSSFLDKIYWKLSNIHVHGSRIISPRKV